MARSTVPKNLFRFSAPSTQYFLSEFTKKTLFFTQPQKFNDPFDCQFEYERILHESIKQLKLEQKVASEVVIKQVTETLARIGVCCFSRVKSNQLMWAHYADSHKGICIGFNGPPLRNETKTSVRRIKYSNAHPLTTLKDELAFMDDFDAVEDKSVYREVINSLVGSKYLSWKYELEERLISRNHGAINIQATSINSVTIGLRANAETKAKVFSALNSPEYAHVFLYKAVRKKEAYALDFEQIQLSELLKGD